MSALAAWSFGLGIAGAAGGGGTCVVAEVFPPTAAGIPGFLTAALPIAEIAPFAIGASMGNSSFIAGMPAGLGAKGFGAAAIGAGLGAAGLEAGTAIGLAVGGLAMGTSAFLKRRPGMRLICPPLPGAATTLLLPVSSPF